MLLRFTSQAKKAACGAFWKLYGHWRVVHVSYSPEIGQ